MNYIVATAIALSSAALLTMGNTALAGSISEAKLIDNELVVKGSGFGNESPMVFWDDSANAMESTNSSSGDEVPVGSSNLWNSKTNQWGTPFNFKKDGSSKTGKQDSYYSGTGKKNYLGWPNLSRPETMKQQIYVSWYYKPNMSPAAEGGSNKFIRIWDTHDGEGTRISWTQMHVTCGEKVDWDNWNGNVNAWNRHEIYVDMDLSLVKTWVNGNQIHDHTNCPKNPAAAGVYPNVYIIGFDHGNEDYAGMQTNIDDIYIGNSLKRLEISESPQWNSNAKREVIPINSWSDIEIKGSLISSSTVRFADKIYIYFFDESGLTSTNGVEVDCKQCPVIK